MKLLVDGVFSGVPICRYFRIGVITKMLVIIAVASSKRPENRFAYANWWDGFNVKVIYTLKDIIRNVFWPNASSVECRRGSILHIFVASL